MTPAPVLIYDLRLLPGLAGPDTPARDHGVQLDGDRIRWISDGRAASAPLADIAEIRLYGGDRSGPGRFACGLRFRDGLGFRVTSAGAIDGRDPVRAAQYRDFVAHLHERLGPRQRAGIRFGAGAEGWRARAMPWLRPLLLASTALIGAGLLVAIVRSENLRGLPLLPAAPPAWLSLRKRWYRKAADQGLAQAQNLLAEDYRDGDGVARDEAIIREHARKSGFPANKITEVRRMIEPTTATES